MRILVVEDEPEFANLIAEGLRDQGMAVDIAYNGLAGASKLDLNPYDVVVLDRDLPGLHGDTLCRMITDSRDPAMILMLTAAGTPAERVAGLALGADDYLPKPLTSPSSRCASARSPAANPPPRTGLSPPPGSSSTRSLVPPPATAGSNANLENRT